MSRGSVAHAVVLPRVWRRGQPGAMCFDEQCVSMPLLGVATLRVEVRHHQVRSCSALVG